MADILKSIKEKLPNVISQAMFEYALLEEETFDYQLLPEFGGPNIESKEDEEKYAEKTTNKLSETVTRMFSVKDGIMAEYIFKRARQRYTNKMIQNAPVGYANALRDRY